MMPGIIYGGYLAVSSKEIIELLLKTRNPMVVNLKANEVVIKAGDTDHCNSESKIPGKLIVTNQRIYFLTKSPDCSSHNLEILPEQIKEVIFYNTKKIFPNGLNLITKAGEHLKFILKKRNAFGELINKMY